MGIGEILTIAQRHQQDWGMGSQTTRSNGNLSKNHQQPTEDISLMNTRRLPRMKLYLSAMGQT